MQRVGVKSGAAGMPQGADAAKLLLIRNLQSAEVVELADTPS
jgi:hypothetical protein